MIAPDLTNGPADAQTPPGRDTEGVPFDATTTLLPPSPEAVEMSGFVPIDGHPGFYRRSGQVMFRVRDRRGRRRWEAARTIKEAERKRLVVELDVERGDYRERSRETFASYARSWIDTYAGRTARGISETTRADYRRRLEQEAIPFLGTLRLSEIEPRDVKDYARSLEARGLAPNTVRLAVAPVRALLATALEEGLLRHNPTAGLRLAQRRQESGEEPAEERVKAMSEQELRSLLAAIEKRAPAWRPFFDFLAFSGLRIGEAVELRWKDVDLDTRTVQVRRRYHAGRVGPPKTKYGRRRLRLTPQLSRTLWRLQAERRAGEDELVFVNGSGGRVDQPNLMGRVLKPAAADVGLGEWVRVRGQLRADSWVGFHSFRHSCATILFRRGWNAVQVQRWLGHHKPSFTLDTYVHLLDEDVPEPAFFDELTAACDLPVTREGRNEPKSASPPEGDVVRLSPPNRPLSSDRPIPAETAADNS